jgi:hypothetical protein
VTAVTLDSPAPRRSGLPMLLLVVGLLALPFVIAAGLYFVGWQPSRTGNHGQLLNPPRPLPADGLRLPDGQKLATADLNGKWLLVLSGSGPCDAGCARRIDEMRRIQVSLDKQMGRVRRVVLTDLASDPELVAARQRQPDLVLAAAPDGWLPGAGSRTGYRLHIVDPQGKLIMAYPEDAEAKGIRADLDRLLKFAWTG